MGWGDEVLVTGEARHLQEADPKHRAVVVYDYKGRPRWSPMWVGNPRILMPHQAGLKKGHLQLKNAARCRPYIDYERMRADFAAAFPGQSFNPKIRDARLPWRFTTHRCRRGELFLPRLRPAGYVVIEPHVKAGIAVNRQWGWERWQAVVDALPRLDWVQINQPGVRVLEGVRHMPGATFPEACRLLSGAAAYVGPEGGLYHAAAALGVAAVAVFGGFVDPATQGYDDACNLYEPMDGQSPCGQRVPCQHCDEALARITPDMVVDGVERALS